MSSTPDMRDLSELNEFIRTAAIGVGTHLGPDSDWAPVAFLVTSDGDMKIVATDGWNNDRERKRYLDQISEAIINIRAVAVGMVSTIWMLTIAKDKNYYPFVHPRPREHPQREEALLVIAMSAEESITAIATIDRHSNQPPSLREWEIVEDEVEGDMPIPLRNALRKVKG